MKNWIVEHQDTGQSIVIPAETANNAAYFVAKIIHSQGGAWTKLMPAQSVSNPLSLN